MVQAWSEDEFQDSWGYKEETLSQTEQKTLKLIILFKIWTDDIFKLLTVFAQIQKI